ncbi:type I restriction-modification system subunit M N-terminal domain-containing protein, partial [Phormidium tenue FACHB-886]|nr:type I restriction-modification system subunit M N-terminal domain-containing protein [Phormidium tenue FACHB-886]
MITGELKSKVDKLWETFWSNGISNPISVIEQISYLLFIKRLDDEELKKEKQAQRLNRPIKSPIFSGKDDPRRWLHFKNLDNPDEKLKAVRDEAFPFIKNLRGEASDNTYAHHMQNAIFLIANPALLASVIEQIDKMLDLLDKQAQASQDQSYVDLMGDLYEYMLSKLTQAGQNGQ